MTSLSETGDTSKTGTKDNSVLLDSEWLQFAGPLFEELSRGKKMDYVWDFDYAEYLSVFRICCQDLQLQLVPYQARHSGPSIDRAQNVRSQEEVRKRGGWQSRQSVARYEKAGRLAAMAEVKSESAADLPGVRDIHRGNLARPKLSGHSSSWPLKKKNCYFADLFSGCGRVAGAARALGFKTREWEIEKAANTISLIQECSSS